MYHTPLYSGIRIGDHVPYSSVQVYIGIGDHVPYSSLQWYRNRGPCTILLCTGIGIGDHVPYSSVQV